MPKVALAAGDTDERHILQLLRATGALCVYGSGFCMPVTDGYFRIVFLAKPVRSRWRSTAASTRSRAELPALVTTL